MRSLVCAAMLFANSNCFCQTSYGNFDRADLVVVGTITANKIAQGWTGRRRNHAEWSSGSQIVVLTLAVSRQLKGSCPEKIDLAAPRGGLGMKVDSDGRGIYSGIVGTRAIWFIRTSVDGDFLLDGRKRLGDPPKDTDDLFHLDGAVYGLSLPDDGDAQIILKDDQIPNRGNVFLDMAELFVHNAAIDPDHRYYYFEHFTDLSPVGFGSEDRSKQEQEMFKNWMDAHLTEALNPKSDAEKMDEYALRIRFGQLEYCDQFTDMFVKLKGKGLTAPFPLSLGSNDNGLRIYGIADPRLARELALGFMYSAEPARKRAVCKVLITRFGEDHFLDVGILEAVSKLMDWPDASPYDDQTHKAFDDLSRQIETVRFRLNS